MNLKCLWREWVVPSLVSVIFLMLALVVGLFSCQKAHAKGSSYEESGLEDRAVKPCFYKIGDSYFDMAKLSFTQITGNEHGSNLYLYAGSKYLVVSFKNPYEAQKYSDSLIQSAIKYCNWSR